MSVNVPTNTKLKEQDVNAKLQLYGIYAAFANGKVPSNKQIDVAMNTALEWPELKNGSKRLSPEGQGLTRDLHKAIEQAKILLLTKNQGNLIQDFIWQTQHLGSGNASKPGAPVDKDTAKQHGNQALEGLRTLGELLITNGQFRKLLTDGATLLRDMAGDAAQKTADKSRPSEDALNKLDEPAEDNTWHEKPDLSKDTLKSNMQNRMPIGKKEAKEAAGDASQSAGGSRDPTAVADRAAQDQQNNTSSGVDAAGGAKTGAQNLKGKISENSSEDQKQKAREYRDRTNNYFKQKMPKERREQIIFRLKKMVVEIQGHSDYGQAIDTLLRLAEEYQGHTKNIAGQTRDSAKGAHDQSSLQSAEADLKTLLERFANSTSFDDLFDSFNQMYRDADRDPELKNWFKDIDRFVRRCLQEQGYVLQDDSNEQWNRLYDHGNFLLRDRYRNHTDRIADEFKFIAGQFDEDPQNKAFAETMNNLFHHLGEDENGKPAFKPHLVKDLTEVILPGLFERIRYVPIPRIEYSDPMVDAVIENLVIEGDNLAPNMFEFGSDNYWRWGRKSIQNRNKNKVMLSVSGIQMDLRDVSYYIKKKEGFPGITDKGVMDIFLGGTGFSFKVAMETADHTDRSHFFKINAVTVDIKNLNIKLKQSNHKLLFALFKPLLLKVMRPILQKVVEKQIRDNVQKLDAKAWAIKKEADRAQEEAKNNPNPDQAKSMYQRYFSAAQREMSKGQQKKEDAKAKSADKHVNMAITQHDSLFKNLSLPGGISSKATEYKELAEKGEKWESPVFSIGSGKETSSLPSITDPRRKQHNVTQGGVRGKEELQDQQSTNGTNSTGYGNNSAGYGGNNNSGFANQVNDAFQGGQTQDYGLRDGAGANGPATGESGLLGQQSAPTGQSGEHTSLGQYNPVLQGRV